MKLSLQMNLNYGKNIKEQAAISLGYPYKQTERKISNLISNP